MARAIDAIELQQKMCALCNQDYSDEPCEPSDCVFIRAINETPTLTPPNEWVSVEERLPEGNGGYIVTACDEGCPAGEGIWYDTVVVFAEYYDGCWTWNDGTEYDLTDIVTHWMPLPAPPDRRPPEGEVNA